MPQGWHGNGHVDCRSIELRSWALVLAVQSARPRDDASGSLEEQFRRTFSKPEQLGRFFFSCRCPPGSTRALRERRARGRRHQRSPDRV